MGSEKWVLMMLFIDEIDSCVKCSRVNPLQRMNILSLHVNYFRLDVVKRDEIREAYNYIPYNDEVSWFIRHSLFSFQKFETIVYGALPPFLFNFSRRKLV